MGPNEALAAVRGAHEPLGALQGLVCAPLGAGSRAEWLGLMAACQELVNTATAIQDAAITRAAAIDDEPCEDGTMVERDHGAGHMALDAPDLVAGGLEVSHVHAIRRVTRAVRCAADVPGRRSGLRGLHEAMFAGRVDDYRVGVVVEELTEVPPDVAAAVVLALDPHLGTETAAALRKRCRRVLARVSPDLLRQRALRARRECGLRRWAASPGVDQWEGTFPSEDAAAGWAAVDALAQRYLADGVCDRVEAARGKALIDLVTGNATIAVQLLVTVPAPEGNDPRTNEDGTVAGGEARRRQVPPTSAPPQRVEDRAGARDVTSAEDLVEVFGALPGGDPVLVRRGWVSAWRSDRLPAPCHPQSGALLVSDEPFSRTYRPAARLAALVKARDGRCRFPGCVVAARFCDLDHVRPWPTGPTTAANLMCLCRRHHRIKQLRGWLVRLEDDGRATWRDPTGRVRSSSPRDLLHGVVLPAGTHDRADDPDDPAGGQSPSARRDGFGIREGGPHSALELQVEHAVLRRRRSGIRGWALWSPNRVGSGTGHPPSRRR